MVPKYVETVLRVSEAKQGIYFYFLIVLAVCVQVMDIVLTATTD